MSAIKLQSLHHTRRKQLAMYVGEAATALAAAKRCSVQLFVSDDAVLLSVHDVHAAAPADYVGAYTVASQPEQVAADVMHHWSAL